MEKAKEFSNFKLYGTLFALGCAGGTIYIIPYVRLVFYDLLLEVAGMNNTQLAAINPITTVVSTFTAIPIAIIVDRLNLKDGIKWALIITTLLAIMYSFLYTSYIGTILTFITIGFCTSIYWPAFSKILSIVALKTDKSGEGKSGLAFGIYYAFNGISAAIVNSLSLWISTQFDDPLVAFKAPIFMAAAGTAVAAILVHFLMDDDLVNLAEQARSADKNGPKNKPTVGDYILLIKNPMVWAMWLACSVGYMLYSLQGYFTPYLSNVVGIESSSAGIFGIIRTYVFLILAAVGGFMADRVFKSPSKWTACAFVFMAAIVAGIFFIPKGVSPTFIAIYTLIPSAFVQMTYTIKYSMINETGLDPRLIGTATACASSIAGVVDSILTVVVGWSLDSFADTAMKGYNVLFYILIGGLLIGAACAWLLYSNNKKRLKKAANA